MKKLFSAFLAVVLLFSGLINFNNVGAIDYVDDQRCATDYPYTLEASENVFDNGSLGQTFVPTQNRLNLLFLDLMVNAGDDESVLTISITDFNEEVVLASSSINITAALDGDFVLNVSFVDGNWNPYDVPLVPGDTYKIKLVTTTGSGNLRWVFKADSNCVVGGAAIKGGVMDLTKDFGFTTRGYNYVAPVVTPVVTPDATPVVVAPANTTTTNPNTSVTNATDDTPETPATDLVNGDTDVVMDDNLESSNILLASAKGETEPFNNLMIIIPAIAALSIGLLIFSQIKFKIFNKLFKNLFKSIKK